MMYKYFFLHCSNMAELEKIEKKNNEIFVTLKISKEEHNILKNETNDLVVLPTNVNVLNEALTTGKLGNSNRIMLPKKMLKRSDIKSLEKRVRSKIFNIDEGGYLLIKIKGSEEKKPVLRWETSLVRK